MRALLVTCCALTLVAAVRPVALAPGDAITQADLFGYLSLAPQAGDWVRYRIVNGSAVVEKTIGFGTETLDGHAVAFVEVGASSNAVVGSPVAASTPIGGAEIVKTYVDAPAFADPSGRYPVLATAFKIGDTEYRIDRRKPLPPRIAANAPAPTFSLLDTLPIADQRRGLVDEVAPEDVEIGGSVVHATRIVARFAGQAAAAIPPVIVEAWQSPDVPLGSVAFRADIPGRRISVDLVAFGRGDYAPKIATRLDDIPAWPGSR